MNKKITMTLAVILMITALTGCGNTTTPETAAPVEVEAAEVATKALESTSTETIPTAAIIATTEVTSEAVDLEITEIASAATDSTAAEPSISEVNLDAGSVTVYDYGKIKLHAYTTGDALGDEAFLVESDEGVVGIEMPSFTANLDAWMAYISGLNKPMNDIFLDAHITGASYIKGLNVYGTQAANEAAAQGSTYTTTQSLAETFGSDFHGGEDIAAINTVIPAGNITIAGIDFIVIDRGDTYDLAIPSINVIYTHMLGKTSHSIIASMDQMDTMLDVLKSYREENYGLVLSGHSTPEGQDAVTEKMAYIETTKALAENCATKEDFISEMKAAFPDYAGENYLEMTAGYLYQ